MCPRLPDTHTFDQSSAFQATGSASSHSNTRANPHSSNSSASHSPALLSSTDNLVLDSFIDQLLTGGQIDSSSSISHMNLTDSSSDQNKLLNLQMPFDLFSALYAGTVTAGGLIGYLKAGSKPSLAAGLIFGSLLGCGTYLTSVNPDNYYLTLGTSSVLAAVMGSRFYKSGKFMPAGLVCAFSLAMVTRCFYRMASNYNNTK